MYLTQLASTILLSRHQTCELCDGSGRHHMVSRFMICPECNGTGEEPDKRFRARIKEQKQ